MWKKEGIKEEKREAIKIGEKKKRTKLNEETRE